MIQILRMGKYFYYWMLQFAFFVAILILAVSMEEPESYDTALRIGTIIFIVLSFIITPFLYRIAWVVDGRRHWIYFAVFILIISFTASLIAPFLGEMPLSNTLSNLMLAFGAFGGMATFLMPFALLFKPKLKINERTTSLDKQ